MTDSKVIGLLEQILSRLSVLEAKVGSGGGGAGDSSNGGGAELPRSVRAFDEFTASFLNPFIAASAKLGGEAASGGVIVKEGFDELRKVLLMAAACKEPTPAALPGVVAGINGKLKAASQNIKRNEWEKHAKTISEGIGCLSWVMVKPAPRDFIETFIGASDYWANGIRKEFRTTNPDQIAFCDTFKALIQELAKYVKEHHTTGLAWNKAGQDTAEWKGDATPSSTPATSSTAAAKPAATAPAKSATAPTANLFAELNKEGAITQGLKKVTKDMQTWRAEYKGGDAKPSAAPAPAKPVANSAAANQPKGPAKLEFNATAAKWVVENQGTTPEPIAIEIKDKRETVYLFGCVGATVSVKGKCKSIVIDSCKKTTLYFEVAMASVEVVNSQRMNVHVLQSVSSVAIDKTDGIVVHLPASSLTTEIVASKSSEMNVSFPDESGELIERPIPEQYVHRIKGTQITADVSDLYSH